MPPSSIYACLFDLSPHQYYTLHHVCLITSSNVKPLCLHIHCPPCTYSYIVCILPRARSYNYRLVEQLQLAIHKDDVPFITPLISCMRACMTGCLARPAQQPPVIGLYRCDRIVIRIRKGIAIGHSNADRGGTIIILAMQW